MCKGNRELYKLEGYQRGQLGQVSLVSWGYRDGQESDSIALVNQVRLLVFVLNKCYGLNYLKHPSLKITLKFNPPLCQNVT